MKKLICLITLMLLSACSGLPSEASLLELPKNASKTATGWSADDPVWGDHKAPLSLVVFSDFQCPFCAKYDDALRQMEREWIESGKLKVQYRDFPLQGHKNALPSARAVLAAHRQQAFWSMQQLVYHNQLVWGESENPLPIFQGYAKDLGLDAQKFLADYESEETKEEILLDLQEGLELGVTGTPSSFLNGQIMVGNWSPGQLRRLLEAALQDLTRQ